MTAFTALAVIGNLLGLCTSSTTASPTPSAPIDDSCNDSGVISTGLGLQARASAAQVSKTRAVAVCRI